MAFYKNSTNSRSRGHSFSASVGVRNTGHLNLLKSGRGGLNQKSLEETLSGHQWSSAERYRTSSLEGQLKILSEEISKWTSHVTSNAEKVIYNAFLPTFYKSQRYCPVSPEGSRPYYISGTLVRSGKLTVKKSGGFLGRGGTISASITYGGSGVPFYAVYVHEIPRQHVPPTRYKFLEQALKEDMSNIKSKLSLGMRTISGTR